MYDPSCVTVVDFVHEIHMQWVLKQNDDGKESVYWRWSRLKLHKTRTCTSYWSQNHDEHSQRIWFLKLSANPALVVWIRCSILVLYRYMLSMYFCYQRQWHNRCDRSRLLCRPRGIRGAQGAWAEAWRTRHSCHRGQQEGICQVSSLCYSEHQKSPTVFD